MILAAIIASNLASAGTSPVDLAMAPTASVSVGEPSNLALSVIPLPTIQVSVGAELLHTPDAPFDQYANAYAAGSWFGRDMYQPVAGAERPVASYQLPLDGAPYFEGKLAYGFHPVRPVRLYLQAHTIHSNLVPDPNGYFFNQKYPTDASWDKDAPVSGWLTTLGPHLDADYTDDSDFPTRGWSGRVAADLGLAQLGNRTRSGLPNDYAIYRAQASTFVPFGADRTVALNLTTGLGMGNIPLLYRFNAGGETYLRGYSYDRFLGDQLAVASVEWRHLAWPHLIPFGDLGLEYEVFLDYGRAWTSRCPDCGTDAAVAFPQDMRPGVGLGLGLVAGRATIGRLELAWGNNGLANDPLFGGAFNVPIFPGVGLAFTESW